MGAAVTGAWERSRRTGNAGRLTDGAGLADSEDRGDEAEPTEDAGKAGPADGGSRGDRERDGQTVPGKQAQQAAETKGKQAL